MNRSREVQVKRCRTDLSNAFVAAGGHRRNVSLAEISQLPTDRLVTCPTSEAVPICGLVGRWGGVGSMAKLPTMCVAKVSQDRTTVRACWHPGSEIERAYGLISELQSLAGYSVSKFRCIWSPDVEPSAWRQYLRGAATSVNLFPNPLTKGFFEDDSEALASDWQTAMNDVFVVCHHRPRLSADTDGSRSKERAKRSERVEK
jgi:hypothetical protein